MVHGTRPALLLGFQATTTLGPLIIPVAGALLALTSALAAAFSRPLIQAGCLHADLACVLRLGIALLLWRGGGR